MANPVVVGMVGAGRGTELHMGGYSSVQGVDVRLKTIVARRMEQLKPAQELYGFERIGFSVDDIINDPEINVVDICTPPCTHASLIERALAAGKHVICEKPLTGYFGEQGDGDFVGHTVSKRCMFECMNANLNRLAKAIESSGCKFMYAENFIYAPAIQRARNMVAAKQSRILYMKGEESLKGSSSPVAGEWRANGGGSLMRVGSHPLAAILWLKAQEGAYRDMDTSLVSVTAQTSCVTRMLSDYEHRHIAARPRDVEDMSTAILSFADGSQAVVIATDVLLGGSRNYVQLYCNDAAINCNLTLSDLMETYFLDEDGLGDVLLSEMLPSKTGWNKPFVVDEVVRGYRDEMQDFCECVAFDRRPQSDFALARDTVRAIYAAYVSADEGTTFQLI